MKLLLTLTKYYIAMIIIFFVGRVSLFYLYLDQFKDENINYLLIFLYGLRMDTIVSFAFLVFPLILLTTMPSYFKTAIERILKYYFLIIFIVIIYIENATIPFMSEFSVRPNYLFINYLMYPQEVFGMIIRGYPMELFIALSMIVLFAYVYIKKLKIDFLRVFEVKYIYRLLLLIPILLILIIGMRSSLGHRPSNPSDAMFSTNRIVNEISKNSIHNIIYAIYTDLKYEDKHLTDEYGKMDIKEAVNRVKKRLNISSNSKTSIFSRLEKTHFKTDNSKNLVVLLVESFGAQFNESLGGKKGVTPHFNKLQKEGIFFANSYPNGIRSNRGIVGVAAGNFSTPGQPILKRSKALSNYFTLSSLLEPYGYDTLFMYGGEARFDNMKTWFSGNGFNHIIEQKDFVHPKFTGMWGVSDEDMLTRANEEFKKRYKNHQKFASIMFTLSSHAPFEFPDNKIKLYDKDKKQTLNNGIKYADYAIGKFIAMAKKEPYYKDTVFMILADHEIRVHGKDVVPVQMMHIPALILGGGIKPMVYKGLTTQPDVLATALDLIGMDLKYPIMGHSIFSDKKQNIALLQFHTTYALRVNNKVTVIRPNKKPETFLFKNKRLVATTSDVEQEKDLLAFLITLNYLYDKSLYR